MPDIYLIPCPLAIEATETIPTYILAAVKKCQVIFAENERTARRYLKSLDREIVIDDFEWFTIHKAEEDQVAIFKQRIKEDKNIAIISEAGCPGVADPGQLLITVAQQLSCNIKPLVGPSSILLALMASGMNGQHFEFVGYLPIDNHDRAKRLKELENSSAKDGSTKIFIETPYRNNQLIETIIKTCSHETMLCIGVDITDATENISSKKIREWKNNIPSLHKRPAIFLLQAVK